MSRPARLSIGGACAMVQHMGTERPLHITLSHALLNTKLSSESEPELRSVVCDVARVAHTSRVALCS